MASKEITVFADEISNTISKAIKYARDYYLSMKMGFISNFSHSADDWIISTEEDIDRRTLQYAKAMLSVQQEQGKVLESEIYRADDKLSSMVGIQSYASDIQYLTSCMADWIRKFCELSIIEGIHNYACPYKASKEIEHILEKWRKFCLNDPCVKKAGLYEEQARLKNELDSLYQTIPQLEAEISNLKEELADRTNNAEFYENLAKREIDNAVFLTGISLRRAKGDVSDLKVKEKILKTQLLTAGVFAVSRKKELEAELLNVTANISTDEKRIDQMEKQLKNETECLPKVIKVLSDKQANLKKNIAKKEYELTRSSALKKRNEERKLEIEKALSEIKPKRYNTAKDASRVNKKNTSTVQTMTYIDLIKPPYRPQSAMLEVAKSNTAKSKATKSRSAQSKAAKSKPTSSNIAKPEMRREDNAPYKESTHVIDLTGIDLSDPDLWI